MGARGAHDHQPLGSYWHLLGVPGTFSWNFYGKLVGINIPTVRPMDPSWEFLLDPKMDGL